MLINGCLLYMDDKMVKHDDDAKDDFSVQARYEPN